MVPLAFSSDMSSSYSTLSVEDGPVDAAFESEDIALKTLFPKISKPSKYFPR